MAGKAYSTEDEEFIRDNFDTMTFEEMAEKLNRSPDAIQMKAKEMGLRRKREDNIVGVYIKKRIQEGAEDRIIQEEVKAKFDKQVSASGIWYYKKSKLGNIGTKLYVHKENETLENNVLDLNKRILYFKKHIKVGDVISIKFKNKKVVCKVEGKYKNFVSVRIRGWLESILYSDILKVGE